jgi:hypothetical protein
MATNLSNHKVTDLEFQVIKAVLESDYMSGDHPVDRPVWYLDSQDTSMPKRSLAGAIASCVKKEYVQTYTEGPKVDHTIEVTQLGYDVYGLAAFKNAYQIALTDLTDCTNSIAKVIEKFNESHPHLSNEFQTIIDSFTPNATSQPAKLSKLATAIAKELTNADYPGVSVNKNHIDILATKLADMLHDTALTIETTMAALFTTADDTIAFFSKEDLPTGETIWTKHRISKRKLVKDNQRIHIDISKAVYQNDELVSPEQYVKTISVLTNSFITDYITEQCITSFDSPFFKSQNI